MGLTGLLLAFVGNQGVPSSVAGPVGSPDAACLQAMASYAVAYVQPLSTAYCDIIPDDASPTEFYVLALRSGRACDGICSDLMGWFGVERSTGKVYDWDITENLPGEPILARGLKSGD